MGLFDGLKKTPPQPSAEREWNMMFVVEVSPHVPYPKQDERWPKYGEPISRLFEPYFKGEKVFQWFKGESENLLAGFNVACFKSTTGWKESDDEEVDIQLFASLYRPVNDFFVRLGAGASITGLLRIDLSFEDFTIKVVQGRTSHSVGRAFFGQLPVESDFPDMEKSMTMFELSGKHFIVYTGSQSGYKRFRGLSKEQAIELANADPSQKWRSLNS
ncbi:MAG: hypothetical protein QUS33_10305 [Dehalococcoidia bacterium]|nr:hypothetical protein [Dehalococcoidia bacterium]